MIPRPHRVRDAHAAGAVAAAAVLACSALR